VSKHATKVTLKTIKSDISKSDSAIREAIANAIDANSKNIYLNVYKESSQGTIIVDYFSLDIADDGDGIPTTKDEFEEVFCQYKVSTKKEKSNYGKRGKGRYTYLTLTNNPEDVKIYTITSHKEYFKINFDCSNNQNIQINCDKIEDKISTPIEKTYITLIQFKNLDTSKFNIKDSKNIDEVIIDIKNEIITFFADRIASESVNIYINDELLKINDYLEQEIITKVIEENKINFNVDFYIWNKKIKLKSDRQKHILYFDNNNKFKGISPSGKYKLAFNGNSQDHSIVVKSNYFNDKDFNEHNDTHNNLFTDDVIKHLKTKITLELENILLEIYKKNIDKVSDEYLQFLKLSQDEITDKVYNTLLLPFVAKFGTKKVSKEIKSVIVNLINILASEAPDSYISNLKTILSLTDEESSKIEYIEENYGIIKAITEKEKIIKRIDFLNTFDTLVNGKDKKDIQERTQLHQVVEKNLWLIDEKFEDIKISDIMSDQSLKTILEKDNFFQFDSEELKEIALEHNINKIPDIYIPIEKDNIIYIIELKKPNVKISRSILDEVEDKYVKTINELNRQNSLNPKKIIAYAISDSKTDNARSRGNINNDDVYIEPKCWSELIEVTRNRYNSKIDDLDNKLKSSQWKDIDDFILSYGGKI